MHPLPFINEGFLTNVHDFILFCYTDGLTETLNEQGEEFGAERLVKYFSDPATRVKDLRHIHHDIIISLDNFKGVNGYRDDITMLSVRVA
jgi:sigma-B regulation protein RsbU (phosphoserine phosphatase)